MSGQKFSFTSFEVAKTLGNDDSNIPIIAGRSIDFIEAFTTATECRRSWGWSVVVHSTAIFS